MKHKKNGNETLDIIADFILRLYELSYIERWNDSPKPFQITELDKQAHKAIIVYLVAHFEEQKNTKIDWLYLIKGIIFEALYRSVLTDIKPQVYYRIMAEKKNEIHRYVTKKLERELLLFDKSEFDDYFSSENKLEKRIIKAAHFLSTYWEFEMIYSMGIRFYGIDEIRKNIEETIEDFFDLIGVERIYLKKKSFNFVDIIGQLRFQKRWIQSPRVPVTTVLGHMFVVACLSFILSYKKEFCNKRIYNNFFAALFHDIPEVATRDIVSPVKKEADLEKVIKNYEKEQVEERIIPLLPDFLHQEFKYLMGIIDEKTFDEFSNRIIKNGKALRCEEINPSENREEFSPIDGDLIKICDKIAAFTEASLSIHHGLKSRHLEEGMTSVYKKLKGSEYEPMLSAFLKKLELSESF
ncbi:MAG: HD domain-containing protein [Brevinematia bacterium]